MVRFDATGPSAGVTPDATLDRPPLDRPFGLAFSPTGELFIINRGFSVNSFETGSVARFLDPEGSPSPNGTIESSDFRRPHGGAFRGNELFTAQQSGDNVLRFLVDATGATPNGAITEGLCCLTARGVVFSPWGEMFVSECCSINAIQRYRFDASGNAIANGVIRGNHMDNPHDMEFSPSGQLFVANAVPHGSISRFRFNQAHLAIPNGAFTDASLVSPIGLAFSPWGELFVSSADVPVVSRFTFNSAGTPHFNGSFATPGQGALDVEFGPHGGPAPGPTEPPFLSDGPISHWRFGDQSGPVAHDSAGSNDGRYVGGVALRLPGAFSGDQAAKLDGKTGHVTIPDSPSLHTGDHFSLEIWIKRRTLSNDVGTEGLFAKGYQLYLTGNGHVVLRKPGSRVITSSTARITDTSTFHHVVATKSGSAAHLYIDGVDVTGPVAHATVSDTNGPLLIGAGAGTFRGLIDEAAVYGHALSATQVARHHDAALP